MSDMGNLIVDGLAKSIFKAVVILIVAIFIVGGAGYYVGYKNGKEAGYQETVEDFSSGRKVFEYKVDSVKVVIDKTKNNLKK